MKRATTPKHSYTTYLKIDKLLECQEQKTEAPDELLFIIIHQVKELWFKLVIHELETCIHYLMESGGRDETTLLAFKTLTRVTATQEVLLRTWHVLTTLTPDEFDTFRAQVGENDASGFQSYQYRHLEFLLGLKNETTFPQVQDGGGKIDKTVDVVAMEGPNPRPRKVIDQLQRARKSPSLYDAIVYHLKKHADLDECFSNIILRKRAQFSKPYVKQLAVLKSWEFVYANRGICIPLYHLAERLIDLESSFRNWRFLHVSIVARVIGNVTGTGKSPGLPYLLTKATDLFSTPIFPELWDVRQKLFNPKGFNERNAGYGS